jgi:hypothetical protein
VFSGVVHRRARAPIRPIEWVLTAGLIVAIALLLRPQRSDSLELELNAIQPHERLAVTMEAPRVLAEFPEGQSCENDEIAGGEGRTAHEAQEASVHALVTEVVRDAENEEAGLLVVIGGHDIRSLRPPAFERYRSNHNLAYKRKGAGRRPQAARDLFPHADRRGRRSMSAPPGVVGGGSWLTPAVALTPHVERAIANVVDGIGLPPASAIAVHGLFPDAVRATLNELRKRLEAKECLAIVLEPWRWDGADMHSAVATALVESAWQWRAQWNR